jgi:hypothetical protein
MSTAVPKTPGFVTIRYVVMSILNRLQDYSMKNYKRLVQIAIEGYTEELSLFHTGNGLEVVYLHMSTAKTVDLPADFITYTKIGFPVNGKLRVLTQHENILFPRVYDDTGDAVGNTNDVGTSGIADAIFFSDHWRNGQWIGGLFGLPGGLDRAYYRVDMERRQIVFSGSTPRSEIVLEYISSGLKSDGSSLIPRECVDALRNYVLWQMVINDMTGFMTGRAQMKTAAGEIARRKQEFTESIAALRSFNLEPTIEELKSALYSGYRQSPKR